MQPRVSPPISGGPARSTAPGSRSGALGLDTGLLIHEHGASEEEASAHFQKWALATPERAASAVRFATDPTWRAYAITYSAGSALCAGYVGDDPSRFATLLTEQVRVADLIAAQP